MLDRSWPFQGNAEAVYTDLHLYRVFYKETVTTLIAAHSYAEACEQLKTAWPAKPEAYVWSHAGPATEHNRKGWKAEIINPEFANG